MLDEPTGDLDTKNSDLIMKIIIDLNIEKGITIIMVTHDTNLKNFATRTIKMLDGKVANDEVKILIYFLFRKMMIKIGKDTLKI